MLNTKLFDHTILKADATEAQVAKICDEALAHDFASVCVNQYYTKFVAEKLKGSDVKVCTVVGLNHPFIIQFYIDYVFTFTIL